MVKAIVMMQVKLTLANHSEKPLLGSNLRKWDSGHACSADAQLGMPDLVSGINGWEALWTWLCWVPLAGSCQSGSQGFISNLLQNFQLSSLQSLLPACFLWLIWCFFWLPDEKEKKVTLNTPLGNFLALFLRSFFWIVPLWGKMD